MTIAETAYTIDDSRVTSSKDLLLFKHALDQVERYVKEAANCGKRCFSYNFGLK